MAARFLNFWQGLWGQRSRAARRAGLSVAEPLPLVGGPRVDIAPDDPILRLFGSVPGVVDLDALTLASPALQALRAAGVQLALPLVSQGELIGLVNLGPRRSEQDYSSDDRRLLNDLAAQAAPAVRVAQLVLQQQAEARERERIQQELRVARLIQQTLLPQTVPTLAGWTMAAHYQPARAVGGDFYDFLALPDGKLGLIIGDVTDKGVPAALVMATTRAIVRGAALGGATPGAVLERANDLLHPDIPPRMFVTCLYAILDPATGRLGYANAGHDLPYRSHAGGVSELRATGMPLGLMPGMRYEEREVGLEAGDQVLFYSDGLVEAHNGQRAMFGFPRLRSLLTQQPTGQPAIPFLLNELAAFTGAGWEQEDDVTLVVLQRNAAMPEQTLTAFALPSVAGNERLAMERVAAALAAAPWTLPPARLERLKTAVAEATMNAIEHGNRNQPELEVVVEVRVSEQALTVRISDQGGAPLTASEAPNLEAKLAGRQSPRGWGLFLIEKMVDRMQIFSDETQHTVALTMVREGETDGNHTA